MRRVLPLLLPALLLFARLVRADETTEAAKTLLEIYQRSFGHPATGLQYHHRIDGPKGVAALSPPEEIRRGEVAGRTMPYGYGSGIQDIALENGQLLFALCEAHGRTGDAWIADKARALFASLQVLARIGPEPGFVPRGPHPDGKSYYRDSSRDQHAAYIEALWRYGRSPLASDADKRFIADTLGKIAARMERNDWRIMVEDNSAQAHVGFAWKQFTTIGAVTLLSALAQVADATNDPHWREQYERFSAEKNGERWSKWLHPDALSKDQPLTLYANQFCQALTVLRRCEKDVARQKQIAEFQRRWAIHALESNVFDTNQWRRLDWAGDRNESATKAQVAAIGLDLGKPMTVLELFDAYDRKVWGQPSTEAFHTMQKLCFGLPSVALHGALLSEDGNLARRVKPVVERMVQEFSAHHAAYDRGENFNRTVILGLLALGIDDPAGGARDLPITGSLGSGPAMDVALSGDRMIVIGGGKLHVADASDPARPRILGTLGGLGNTRQVVAGGDVAYVGSREDGLFVVDVSNAANPRLINHYDTIEFATGLALAGDVLFVALRQFGVELVDVSQPSQPKYLGVARTGEAQSVAYHDGHLYAGVWGSSEVVTVDVRDPRAPRIVSRTPLDGYGDGLDVRDGFLYAATGHHSREPHQSEGDPGYGRGHGLEIFDLKDPAKPAFMSRVKFPPFYTIGNDMWGVSVVDGHAFVADTHNGVFVVDVKDPRHPVILSHRRLPVPEGKHIPDCVGGLAVGRGHIYAAGASTDLHVIAAPELARPISLQTGPPPRIGPAHKNEDERFISYHPAGQVHAVAMADDNIAVAACGSAGLHVVRLGTGIERVSTTSTEDFATDVCVRGRIVFAAEGKGGMSIWELDDDGNLIAKGRYRMPNGRVRYLTVPAPGRYALVQIDAARLHIVDVSDVENPRLELKEAHFGLLYGHQLLDELAEDRYAAAFWHVSGIHWYDLAAKPPRFEGQHPAGRVSMLDGIAVHRGHILSPRHGGYVRFARGETGPLDELPLHRVDGLTLRGRPVIDGDLAHFCRRDAGEIITLDLADPEKPKLVESLATTGNPGAVVPTAHGLLIPDGNGGLLLRR